MAALDPEALIKRAERANRKREAFAQLMQDCHAYALPERDSWAGYGYGGDRHVRVYDSTAVVSAARFANRLQSALFPPQQRWARLALPPELEGEDEALPVQAALEQATARMFAHIHASNFDVAANEWAQEMAAGTACLLVENGRAGTKRTRAPLLRFTAVPAGLVSFDEGPFSVVEGVFYQQKMPARLILRSYPDATLPAELTEARDADEDREVELLQATYYDAEDDLFRFELLHGPSKARLVQRTYRTMPWIITRWTKAPGETHGRGPLTQALPDIRTVNKLCELMLKAGSLAVGGVWTATDDGVLNAANVRIVPGAVIPVRSNSSGGAGPSLKPLEFAGQFQLNAELQAQMQTRIRQVMFDNPLPPEVEVGLTATEVIERVRRFQADTGAFGRLHVDAVQPLVLRCIDILDDAGELAAPELKGLLDLLRQDTIRVQARGALASAQDQADVQAVMQLINGAAAMGEWGLRMLDAALDLDRTAAFVAKRLGVPAELVPTQAERDARRQAETQAREQQGLMQSPVAAQLAGAAGRAMADQGRAAA